MNDEQLQRMKIEELVQKVQELEKAIQQMNEIAQRYAAENARLQLHLDIAVEALEQIVDACSITATDVATKALAKIRKN